MIDPWVVALSPLMSFTKKTFDVRLNRMVPTQVSLYYLDEKDNRTLGYIPEGLLYKVLDYLNRTNIQYVFKDLRKWAILPIPIWDAILFKELREGQSDALAAIATNNMGIIKAATGYGKSYILVQICKMYPKLNIVITTARVSVLKEIFKRIHAESTLTDQVGCISGWLNTGNGHRITVSTIKSLAKTDMDNCDLLLADECHNFGASCAASLVCRFKNARKFGLSASPKGRQDNTDMVTESLFGKVLFDYSYEKSQEVGAVVPIEVNMYYIGGPDISMFKTSLAKKRHGIWHNNIRNTKIAELARMHVSRGRQTLIMVETLEHLMYIKKLLPEAAITYASCSKKRYKEYVELGFLTDPYRTTKEISQVQTGMETGEIRLCISTMVFKEGVDFTHLEVLIRGETQSGIIPLTQIGGRLSRKTEVKTKGILIDFMNQFDPGFLRAATSRIAKYIKMKWEVKYDNKL